MNLNHKTLYFRKKCFEIKVDVYEIVLFGMSGQSHSSLFLHVRP